MSDNYAPATALTAYFPTRDVRSIARHWANEKLVHDLAAVGLITFFEGSGDDPTSLTGYASGKIWLRVEAGVTSSSGTVRLWNGSNPASSLANWPVLTPDLFASYLSTAAGGSALTPELGTFTPLGTGSVESTLRAKAREWVSVYDFGATGDGSANDTSAMTAFLTYLASSGKHGIIPWGTYSVTAVAVTVTGNVSVECYGTIVERSGASASTGTVRIIGNGSNSIRWRGGIFNQNGAGRTAFEASTFAYSNVYIDEIYGFSGQTTSNGSAGGIAISNCAISETGWGYIHDQEQGAAVSIGSVPRCLSLQSTGVECNAVVRPGLAKDVHGFIVIGDMGGGDVTTFGGWGHTIEDNGIYCVGDARRVQVNDLRLYNVEEPVVLSGSGDLEVIGGEFEFTNAFGVENCNRLSIKGAILRSMAEGSANIIKTRVDNTATGAVVVDGCEIEARCTSPMFGFTTGSVSQFTERNNRIRMIHDSGIGTSETILSWSTGDQFISEGSSWILEDATSDINNNSRFITVPTLTKESRWDSDLMNLTGNSSCEIRLNGFKQQLMSVRRVYSLGNVDAFYEPNFGGLTSAPARDVVGNAAPSAGYWQAGSRVWDVAPSAGGTMGWVCVTAGSPGTWKTFGAIAA